MTIARRGLVLPDSAPPSTENLAAALGSGAISPGMAMTSIGDYIIYSTANSGAHLNRFNNELNYIQSKSYFPQNNALYDYAGYISCIAAFNGHIWFAGRAYDGGWYGMIIKITEDMSSVIASNIFYLDGVYTARTATAIKKNPSNDRIYAAFSTGDILELDSNLNILNTTRVVNISSTYGFKIDFDGSDLIVCGVAGSVYPYIVRINADLSVMLNQYRTANHCTMVGDLKILNGNVYQSGSIRHGPDNRYSLACQKIPLSDFSKSEIFGLSNDSTTQGTVAGFVEINLLPSGNLVLSGQQKDSVSIKHYILEYTEDLDFVDGVEFSSGENNVDIFGFSTALVDSSGQFSYCGRYPGGIPLIMKYVPTPATPFTIDCLSLDFISEHLPADIIDNHTPASGSWVSLLASTVSNEDKTIYDWNVGSNSGIGPCTF